MAKTRSTRLSKRQSLTVGEEDRVKHEDQAETVPDSELKSTEVEIKMEDKGDKQELQMNIEVKGNTPTVTVSWEEKNTAKEGEEMKTEACENDQMMGSEKQSQTIASAGSAQGPDGIPEAEVNQGVKEESQNLTQSTPAVATPRKRKRKRGKGDGIKKESNGNENIVEKPTPTSAGSAQVPDSIPEAEMDGVEECQNLTLSEDNESTPAVAASKKRKRKRGKGDGIKKESNENDETVVNGKRKAEPTTETSPTKKPKLINDGFCVYVGKLNSSKKYDEVKDSLAKYLMTQSLLFQEIRLDRSRKHAFVDLASEMDLTKALTLNGETVLDKPMVIAKAKVKIEGEEKVKGPPMEKKDKDARCLFLKNIPYNATKEDILKSFPKAVTVRFPGGTKGPSQGIAFVEFKNKKIAEKFLEKKQGTKIQDRVLIVDTVGEAQKANTDNNRENVEAAPSDALFVSNLPFNITERQLKAVFQEAVSFTTPKSRGKAKGYSFVKFPTVADAEKALQSAQNIKISNRTPKVQFCDGRPKPEIETVQSKTLIVVGLAEKTTPETLKIAFEGALSARIPTNKETKRFGFVEFESEEHCRAIKEAMEDCEIDGRKVTVAYAKPKGAKEVPVGRRGLPGRLSAAGANRGGKMTGGGRKTGASQKAVKKVK
ncbi:nucleolin-like [Menidia menidia]